MGHDHGSYQSPADSPGGGPGEVFFLVLAQVFDLEGLGKVLSQVVAGSHLDRLPIRHHSFYSRGVDCALELLTLSLLPHKHRYGDLVFDESSIDLKNRHDFLLRFFLGLMDRMSLLPEKLASADERFGRSNLGAQDAVPDVDEDRQIPPALDPSAVRLIDYRLGRGPYGESLAELIVSRMRDPEYFRCKALEMFG